MDEGERVMVFIDGSNVFWGCRYYEQDYGIPVSIDYAKLVQHLVGNRRKVRAIFFCSKPDPPPQDQENFHGYLRKNGIQVVDKLLKVRTDPKTGKQRWVEKGVDVALATDLLGMAWEGAYDTAILISGDADYLGAVQKVMSKGKNVEIVSFRRQCSKDLQRAAAGVKYLDDFIASISQIAKAP